MFLGLSVGLPILRLIFSPHFCHDKSQEVFEKFLPDHRNSIRKAPHICKVLLSKCVIKHIFLKFFYFGNHINVHIRVLCAKVNNRSYQTCCIKNGLLVRPNI